MHTILSYITYVWNYCKCIQLPTKKTMSGLSLALMNECQITGKDRDVSTTARDYHSNNNNHNNINNRVNNESSSSPPVNRLKYYPRQISTESADSARRNSIASAGMSISSTPPFSQSPNPACYFSGMMTTPITISATPPFHNTPISCSRRDSPLSQVRTYFA